MSFPTQDPETVGKMLLNSVQGLGPVTLARLMDVFANDPWAILNASPSDLKKVRGVGIQTADSIFRAKSTDWIDRETRKLEKMGAYFLHGKDMPHLLKELDDPPIGLYCLGKIPPKPCISIVGTRSPSLYGKKMARKIAYELAQSGICIASGMARGIDTEAHIGALDAGGKTLAFLGSGLDIIYPPENLELYRKIQSSGAVLSEFPLGRRANRGTFPMRNRLVAGIALAVIVIESAKSGGSMITARLSGEQGRTVFALPGRVDQPESQGCLSLIRDGATLVRNAQDIIDEIAPMIPAALHTPSHLEPVETKNSLNLEKEDLLILEALSGRDPLGVDQLQYLTDLSVSDIMPALTNLEIENLIIKRKDGKYEKT